jgi:hypothetical protein
MLAHVILRLAGLGALRIPQRNLKAEHQQFPLTHLQHLKHTVDLNSDTTSSDRDICNPQWRLPRQAPIAAPTRPLIRKHLRAHRHTIRPILSDSETGDSSCRHDPPIPYVVGLHIDATAHDPPLPF